MPLYELTVDRLEPIPVRFFIELGVGERADMQRLRSSQPEVREDQCLYVWLGDSTGKVPLGKLNLRTAAAELGSDILNRYELSSQRSERNRITKIAFWA